MKLISEVPTRTCYRCQW